MLDAGRELAVAHPGDANTRVVEGYALDLAVALHYDPLVNRDAASWFVRAAAEAFRGERFLRGLRARSLLAKLDAEEADPSRLAADADADATANVRAFPKDAAPLVDLADADLRAFALSKDAKWRALAVQRAAAAWFPFERVPAPLGAALREAAAALSDDAGASGAEHAAALAVLRRRWTPPRAAATPAAARLAAAAPADEYFGRAKLSPIGIRNELIRIGRYLDAGPSLEITGDALAAVDAVDDLRRRYPRDYELPRLLATAYDLLGRIDAPEAQRAAVWVRRVLTVDLYGTPEAIRLLSVS